MTPEIIIKLNKFLNTHDKFKEECEAVYLMVELRKLLDREHERDQFPIIRFYCDWTVHISKDRNQADIEDIMKSFNDGINNPEGVISFFSLSELRKEMSDLFRTYGLKAELCQDDNNWKHFVDVFIQVLADQPIMNPINSISSIAFIPGDKGTNKVTVKFTNQLPPITIEVGR